VRSLQAYPKGELRLGALRKGIGKSSMGCGYKEMLR
jgi:hypothetical protein